jgi:hypothetical protein
MTFVKARGNSFYYEEQGDGPPILLIPPAGSTRQKGRDCLASAAHSGLVAHGPPAKPPGRWWSRRRLERTA